MPINSGKLQHRVRIERLDYFYDSNGQPIQNPDTGDTPEHWVEFKTVWAAIEPLSAKEFIQSAALQSQITARITIRHIDGLDASMRIVHVRRSRPNVIYNPAGFPPDKSSGLEYITIPCSQGVNEG